MSRVLAALAGVALVLSGLAGPASAEHPIPRLPRHHLGPALRTPVSELRSALLCSGDLRGSSYEPVLLVAGTGATPHEQYSWNYEPALTRLGVPWCAVTVPDHTLGDIQVDAEYLVFAVRSMYAASGRQIAIVGHSQGGMIPRWPLKFWPDVRRKVADMVSLAADNHGTSVINALGVCASTCVPAAWQQKPGSAFLHALNFPVETYAGVAYTQIFTADDELSTPAGPQGTSPLHTGGGQIANIELQQVCPLDVGEHIAIGSTDPVGFALVLDAITHSGPADRSRIDRAVCLELTIPGLAPASITDVLPTLPYLISGATFLNLVGVKKVSSPPALRWYARQ